MQDPEFDLPDVLENMTYLLPERKGESFVGVYMTINPVSVNDDPSREENLIYVLAADGRQAAYQVGPVYIGAGGDVKAEKSSIKAKKAFGSLSKPYSRSIGTAKEVLAYSFCWGIAADEAAVERYIDARKPLLIGPVTYDRPEIMRVLRDYAAEIPIREFLNRQKPKTPGSAKTLESLSHFTLWTDAERAAVVRVHKEALQRDADRRNNDEDRPEPGPGPA